MHLSIDNIRSLIIVFLCFMLFIGCKSPSKQEIDVNTETQGSTHVTEITQEDETEEDNDEENDDDDDDDDDDDEVNPEVEIDDVNITQNLLDLESEYAEMLAPIASLKITKPVTYWFIVSWLKTNYKTPNWDGYYSEEWKIKAKQNGIDCSGFSRVMLDQIFDKEVSGGSQRLLDHYSTRIGLESLDMGDLVFFKAPYATNDRIVHVGVYLQDKYFVHATSTKSAAIGMGLAINSLEEENWAKEFVSGGRLVN